MTNCRHPKCVFQKERGGEEERRSNILDVLIITPTASVRNALSLGSSCYQEKCLARWGDFNGCSNNVTMNGEGKKERY